MATNVIPKWFENPAIQEFMQKNVQENPEALILKFAKHKDLDIKGIVKQITLRKKAEKKMPTWLESKCFFHPIAIEQASSERIALYKAGLFGKKNVLDLSAGMGVDAWAFGKIAEFLTVLEPDLEKFELLQFNFKKLNAIGNCTFLNQKAEDLNIEIGTEEILVYVDPDRRPEKNRINELAESTPNSIEIIEKWLSLNCSILVKASPMEDLRSIVQNLKTLSEIHAISLKNELKEILLYFKSDSKDEPTFYAHELDENSAIVIEGNSIIDSIPFITPIGKFVFEPSPAIYKTNLNKQLANQYELNPINQNSGYLTGNEAIINFPGKCFEVIEALPFQPKNIKKHLKAKGINRINLAVRAFVDTPEAIWKKLGMSSGGVHFLVCTQIPGNNTEVLLCKRVF